jgi:predicted  nucleic acid-binding Zn-ribbon protein
MGLFEMQMVIDNIQHQLDGVKADLDKANKRIEELEKQLEGSMDWSSHYLPESIDEYDRPED